MEENKSFGQVMNQIGDFVKAMTTRQKAMLLAGAVVVAATLFVFVRLMNKTEYKPLYSGMSAADAQSLASRLAAKNIAYQISPDGTAVSVAADKLDVARLEVASEGAPRSGRLGFEIFDKPNWGATDFTEKVNYQRALEAELEKTIQTLSEVAAVRVHLVIPDESLFVEDRGKAKAAVMVKLRGGRFSDETHRAIAELVASAVDKLRPEDVTVVDADTNLPFRPDQDAPDGGRANGLEQQLSAKLVQTLEPVVGHQRARASVRVEYDLSSSEESQESYDPNTAVALTMQKTQERSGGTAPAGVPGTASNVPGSQASQSAASTRDDSTQSSSSENSTYAVNKIIRHTITPAGRVRRLAAAVVVDDATDVKEQGGKRTEVRRRRTPEEMKQLEDLAKAAIGIDPTRGDVISVQNLSFQAVPYETPVPPSRWQRMRVELNDWSALLRIVGILILFLAVYVLFLRPIKKNAVDAFQQLARGRATEKLKGHGGSRPQLEADELELGTATPEVKRAAALKQHLLEKVKAEPVSASRLVQSWIREGGAE